MERKKFLLKVLNIPSYLKVIREKELRSW